MPAPRQPKDPMTGPRIRQCRKAKGMTVAELAQKSGLAPTTLYDLERGESSGSGALHRIADALRVNPHWLETGKGPREPGAAMAATLHSVEISEEGALVGAEWDKLPAGMREIIRTLIHLMVAEQKRDSRKKRRTEDERDRPPTQ